MPLRTRLRSFIDHIVGRLVTYYAFVGGVFWAAWSLVPQNARDFLLENMGPVLGDARVTGDPAAPLTSALQGAGTHHIAMLAVLTSAASLILALPMAWVYMYTRQKKGYQQSVVHTIVLLPPVVGAVSLLVRNNVGLAFSLAGIVAAVRFRTTLDDSRDAVFIFAVSALGLACGVHLEFAAALSVLFSWLALGLWYTDFGRTPPGLEGARAEQHLQRAISIANRTSQFVARIDREVLESLAPAQLDALADRVKKRRNELSPKDDEWDASLVVLVTHDSGRPVVERLLGERTKKFEFARAEFLDGATRLTYLVRARKSVPIDTLVTFLENDGAPHVQSAILED